MHPQRSRVNRTKRIFFDKRFEVELWREPQPPLSWATSPTITTTSWATMATKTATTLSRPQNTSMLSLLTQHSSFNTTKNTIFQRGNLHIPNHLWSCSDSKITKHCTQTKYFGAVSSSLLQHANLTVGRNKTDSTFNTNLCLCTAPQLFASTMTQTFTSKSPWLQ